MLPGRSSASLTVAIVVLHVMQATMASADLSRQTQQGAVCKTYAARAVEHQRRNFASNCGYTGPAWNLDQAAHYNWCMSLQDAPYFRPASKETGLRERALRKCNAKPDSTGGGSIGGTRCQRYVATALSKATANVEYKCGFPNAGRFTLDANAHKRFCDDSMKANNLAIIDFEENARNTAIDQCMKK